MQTGCLDLEELANGVRLLSNEEWDEYIKLIHWLGTEDFPKNNTYIKNGNIYGFAFDSEGHFWDRRPLQLRLPSGVSITIALSIFANQLDFAVQRMRKLFEGYRKSWPFFPVKITKGRNFHCFCTDLISCGKIFVELLIRNAGSDKFRRWALSIQSQYFHELIHGYIASREESLPLFGEFLYEPAANEQRNEVFMELTQSIRNSHDTYVSGWRTATRILLWEYKKLNPVFSIPRLGRNQKRLLSKLHELYANVPHEQRDDILRKYIKENREETNDHMEEVKKWSQDYARELNLKF